MQVVPPDLNSNSARLADWIELVALTSPRRSAAIALLRSQVRKVADERDFTARDVDSEADIEEEPEITDRLSDNLEESLFDEITFRKRTIGASYPFELLTENGGRSHLLKLRKEFLEPGSGQLFYVFCLLDSGIRQGLVSHTKTDSPLIQRIANVFQICSCIAVGGYATAQVTSFGFPRPTGDGFLPALKNIWARYGSYEVIDSIPHGFDTKLKDGGVDLIAWRHFLDGFASTILIIGQVASGLNWKGKSVIADIRGLRNWFNGSRFENVTPALCIPMPLWFDLDGPPKNGTGATVSFEQGVRIRFEVREPVYGLIFDRGRIATSCAQALLLASEKTQRDRWRRSSGPGRCLGARNTRPTV